MDDHFISSAGSKAGTWEQRTLIAGIAGAAVGLLGGGLLTGKIGFYTAISGLIVEIAGLGTSVVIQLVREWKQLRSARAEYAKELELGFELYQQLVQQVRKYPLEQRKQRQRYVQARQSTMQDRLGLITGGIERLGILPLLLALYLQFKDWVWGDWATLQNINLLQGLLVWALMLAYALCWYVIRLRTRVQAYEALLTEANRQDEERTQPLTHKLQTDK